jgi:hypothetical protein
MNLNVIFIIAALGVTSVAAYMTNDWASTHGLTILVNGKWVIQATGWPAVWPSLGMGFLVGTVVGLTIGTLLSDRLIHALKTRKNKAAEKAEKTLSKLRQEMAMKSDNSVLDDVNLRSVVALPLYLYEARPLALRHLLISSFGEKSVIIIHQPP